MFAKTEEVKTPEQELGTLTRQSTAVYKALH